MLWLAIQEWIVYMFESVGLHYNQMTLIDYPQIYCILGIKFYLPFLENKPQAQVFLCCLLEQSYVHSWNRWVSCSCRHLDQPPCMCQHQGSMRKSNNKGVHFKDQQVREVWRKWILLLNPESQSDFFCCAPLCLGVKYKLKNNLKLAYSLLINLTNLL